MNLDVLALGSRICSRILGKLGLSEVKNGFVGVDVGGWGIFG